MRTIDSSAAWYPLSGTMLRRTGLGLGLTLGLLLAGCGAPATENETAPDDEFDPGSLAQLQSGVTVCARGSTLPGIDVSYYQGAINWAQVKGAGIKFAIIRVSDGTGFMDPKFESNWAGSKAQGVVHGTYQFFRPGQSATAQADIVINNLRKVGFGAKDIPPVLDVEVTDGQSNDKIAAGIRTWVSRVTAALGRKPLVYTSPGFWSSRGNPTIKGTSLWVAHWGVSCPNAPSTWPGWEFWQYSATGRVPGIVGDVDLDKFNGTLAELQSL